jgi:hypothetical protein
MRRLILSVALGFATSAVIGLANEYVPYSGFRVRVLDALTLPGAIIAGLAYPQGIHTGRGAPTFGIWAMAANFVVYVAFWYVCLRVVGRIRRKSQPRPCRTGSISSVMAPTRTAWLMGNNYTRSR